MGGLAREWKHFPPPWAGRAGDTPTPYLAPGARDPNSLPERGGRREPQGPCHDGRWGEATIEPPSLSKGLFQARRDRSCFPGPAHARGGGEKKQPHVCPQPSASNERVY